jgi:hypothetical protein
VPGDQAYGSDENPDGKQAEDRTPVSQGKQRNGRSGQQKGDGGKKTQAELCLPKQFEAGDNRIKRQDRFGVEIIRLVFIGVDQVTAAFDHLQSAHAVPRFIPTGDNPVVQPVKSVETGRTQQEKGEGRKQRFVCHCGMCAVACAKCLSVFVVPGYQISSRRSKKTVTPAKGLLFSPKADEAVICGLYLLKAGKRKAD